MKNNLGPDEVGEILNFKNKSLENSAVHESLFNIIATQDTKLLKTFLLDHCKEPIEWLRSYGIVISIPLDWFSN
jgi:hypothetical protein